MHFPLKNKNKINPNSIKKRSSYINPPRNSKNQTVGVSQRKASAREKKYSEKFYPNLCTSEIVNRQHLFGAQQTIFFFCLGEVNKIFSC